ncbi:MAG: TM1802 family CRISPR-associated protein [Halorhabdus sp.]
MLQGNQSTRRAEGALERLPDRRPASLYDVAVQYSILDWYQTITSDDLSFELAPDHLAFMTPLAKPNLYDEPDNALVVYVDLSDPESPQFRSENPVTLEHVGRSIRYKLGHGYPENKTSAMTDYSITTHKEASEHHLAGQRDDAWGTNNIKDRFTDWAHSDAANRVLERDDVEDTWIIDALQQLGDDEAAIDALTERADFPLDPTDEDTEHEVFVTVRIKLSEESRYHWPGEIPALNEVMVEQKAERFENMGVEDAGGDGVGYVTDDEGRVTGGSAGLLGMYGKKQREHFTDLSPDGSAAWRSRPIARETAAALATASSIFEEFYQGLGESRRLYVVPYLGAHPQEISPGQFDRFATTVFQPLRDAENTDFERVVNEVFYKKDNYSNRVEPLFPEYERESAYEGVRVATAFTVSGNPDRVFFEATNTDPYRPLELKQAHEEIIEQSPLAGEGVFADVVDNSNSALLARSGEALRAMALFGSYFERTTEPTRSSEETQDTPKAGDIDDVRARRLRQFLTNETVPLRPLLEEYLHRVVQRQRDRFGQSDTSGIPTGAIVEQYLQLRSLDAIDALGAGGQSRPIDGRAHETTLYNIATVTQSNPDTTYDSRAERLETFIDTHAVLAENESREAVFLIGGLVGLISNFQRRDDISSTLVRRYPVDYLTKQSVTEVTNEVLQLANTYTEEEEYFPAQQANEYMRRLPDLMLSENPRDWQFTQSELQWLYALGIAYGSNDKTIDSED